MSLFDTFTFYRQHDAMQCGITCLKMVCKYYGREYSLDELSKLCSTSRAGVTLLGINEAASELGFRTFCGKPTIEQLTEAPLPAILHWNQNHFVVLYKVKKLRNGKHRYYIADPGRDLLCYTDEEMQDYWAVVKTLGDYDRGVALFLQPMPQFYENNRQERSEKRSFGFLLGYLKQYRRYFGQIILGLLLGSIIQLIFPFLTQAIVDVGINYRDINFIYLILLAQLTLTISRTAVDFIRRWILLHISMRINISLISDFFIKLLRLPMSFFDTKLTGDIMQRMTDHRRIESFLTGQTLSILFSIINFIIFGIVLLCYNTSIFAVFALCSLIYAVWIILFLRKRKQLDYLYFEKQAANNNKTLQFIIGMQEIKLQDCEQRRRWEWEDAQADLFDANMKSLKLQQTQEAGSIFINETKNIIITVLAATAVINNEMTLGMMLAVQYIIGQLNAPVEQLLNFIYSMQDVSISLERINEIHEKPNEASIAGTLTSFDHPSGCDIKLNDVVFRYDKHLEPNIIDHVTTVLPRGKVTAIVGTSGSGKTTLIKLLLGYYPLLHGQIIIGSHPINDYNLKWWRRQCGVVMQDGFIFSESIARNIAVDDGEIDRKRLLHAARIANIEDYIENLPLKYNTIIGQDGIGLSQGQKQRILIARAVYKDPPYIFLDEATNALDANNERAIVENLARFYHGKTVVVVAHRLSTVRHADNIIVLEQGKIVENGQHEDLITAKGAYYNLVKNQLELGN